MAAVINHSRLRRMKIDETSFGSIRVDGRCYRHDILILPPRVVPSWWRQEGHRLALADLAEVLAYAPEILVIGTGAYGRLQVPAETLAALAQTVAQVEVHPTEAAARRFNELSDEGRRVGAALHLTC